MGVKHLKFIQDGDRIRIIPKRNIMTGEELVIKLRVVGWGMVKVIGIWTFKKKESIHV
jgi:hypothetical protein